MLKLKDVEKTYENTGKVVLKDINLTIHEGEFVCMVGPSGSGKSTLLNCIAGLEMPTGGEILLDGEQIKKPGADRVVMFQESALFPWLNVLENVSFGMKMLGIDPKEQKDRAMNYLEMVHMAEYAHYAVSHLSGGMKQRVQLARALAMDSQILLMDEPFSALDKQTINILRDEVERIWEETNKTILFITHSVEEAVFFANRIYLMSAKTHTIAKTYEIDLPRPRHIEQREFLNIRREILEEIRNQMAKGKVRQQ